jgi:hypothetical protein
MWLRLLVFASDFAITWLAAKEQLALMDLQWRAVVWDALLTLAIAINMIGFAAQSWAMVPWSVVGSVLGISLVIYHGRKTGVRSGACD